MSNKLAKNTLYAAYDKFITTGLGFIFIPVAINFLGKELFGVYLILTMFTVFGALSFLDLGLGTGVQYYISIKKENKKQLQQMVITTLLLFLLISIFFSTIFYLTIPYLVNFIDNTVVSNDLLRYYLILLAINFFMQFLIIAYTSILEGMSLFYIVYRNNIIYNSIQIIIVSYLLSKNGNLNFVFEFFCFITAIRLTHFHFIVNKYTRIQFKIYLLDMLLVMDLISYSLYIFINRIIGVINNQIDRLLIIKFLSPVWMTVYEIVTKPVAPIKLIVQILNATILPHIAELYESAQYEKIRFFYRDIVRYCYLIILPISIFLFFYLEIILRVWAGSDNEKYSYLSRVIIITFLLTPISDIAGTVIAGIKAVKPTIKYSVFSTLINVILSIFLMGKYGILGLLLATFLSILFVLKPIINIIEEKIKTKLDVLSMIGPIFLSHIPFAILISINNIIVKNLFFNLIFMFFLLVMQFIFNYFIFTNESEKKIFNIKLRSLIND